MVATKRVYDAIAEILKELYDEGILVSPMTAEKVADVFARDNPRFRSDLFMEKSGADICYY